MADNSGSDDNERSLYLRQVRYLEEQLERCQLKCDEVEKQNKDLTSQYSALEKDKKDITDYLKHNVAAKDKMVDELLEQLQSQQQTAEQDREALSLQHSQQKQKLQEQINKLASQSMTQAAKIEEQKDQLMQLMQQLQYVESLEKKLANQKEEYKAGIHNLKMEAAVERANNRMIRSGDMRDTVDDLVKMKISDTLQHERAQHREHEERLQFLHSESMHLRKEKDALQDRNRDLCIQKDNLKRNFKMVKRESVTYKKEVKQVSDNCKQLKVDLKDCSITHQHIMAHIKGLRQRLDATFEERRKKADEVDQLGAKLQKERSRQRQLEGTMQEAAIILRHILRGFPTLVFKDHCPAYFPSILAIPTADYLDQDLEKSNETQWKVRRLLEILESVVPHRTISTLSDSIEKNVQGQKSQTFSPKSAMYWIVSFGFES